MRNLNNKKGESQSFTMRPAYHHRTSERKGKRMTKVKTKSRIVIGTTKSNTMEKSRNQGQKLHQDPKNNKAFCNKGYRMTLKSKVQDERVTNKVKSDH